MEGGSSSGWVPWYSVACAARQKMRRGVAGSLARLGPPTGGWLGCWGGIVVMFLVVYYYPPRPMCTLHRQLFFLSQVRRPLAPPTLRMSLPPRT